MVDLAGYLFNHWANRDVLWNDGSWHIDSHYVKGVSGNMEYFRVKCALKCWYTVFYCVFPVWPRFARHSANTWNGDTKLGIWESSHIGLSDPQSSMSQLALVAEILLLEHGHFTSEIDSLSKPWEFWAWSWNLVYATALLFGFHTHQSACELSIGLLSYCSSKITISRVWGIAKKNGAI